MTDTTERDDFLDFPGADELVGAGSVAPPSPGRIAAVREILALVADRETERMSASAPEGVLSTAVAGRKGPRASLSPPEDPLVVLRPGDPSWTAARRSRGARRRRVLIAAAAVATITAGAIVYPVLDAGDKPATTASAAATFLNEMAEVSAESSATESKYWKVRTEGDKAGSKWKSTVYFDRAGRTWELNQATGKLQPKQDRTKWHVGDKYLDWSALDKLPTDQKRLTALFPKDASTRFYQAARLLGDSPARPELRAALFRIMADSPAVTLTPGTKDHKGRQGTSLRYLAKTTTVFPDGGKATRWEVMRYVVDPKTARVLEASNAAVKAPMYDLWLEVGPADRLGGPVTGQWMSRRPVTVPKNS
ncbi:hypothetical protein [Streptomyces sp. NPDC058694]|uniref:hypothetical protein n=1 Tax=Streptomyces sp. NPDC058694 TaxID=3346603 RepID=UPI00365F2847